jgi:hypothetical protein
MRVVPVLDTVSKLDIKMQNNPSVLVLAKNSYNTDVHKTVATIKKPVLVAIVGFINDIKKNIDFNLFLNNESPKALHCKRNQEIVADFLEKGYADVTQETIALEKKSKDVMPFAVLRKITDEGDVVTTKIYPSDNDDVKFIFTKTAPNGNVLGKVQRDFYHWGSDVKDLAIATFFPEYRVLSNQQNQKIVSDFVKSGYVDITKEIVNNPNEAKPLAILKKMTDEGDTITTKIFTSPNDSMRFVFTKTAQDESATTSAVQTLANNVYWDGQIKDLILTTFFGKNTPNLWGFF